MKFGTFTNGHVENMNRLEKNRFFFSICQSHCLQIALGLKLKLQIWNIRRILIN